MRKTVELVFERSPVHPRGRRELGAEDPYADSPKAAERPEPVPVPPGDLHRRMPVRAHAELLRGHTPPSAARNEDPRHVGEAPGPPLEEPLRLLRLHSAYVDALDPHACGDLP